MNAAEIRRCIAQFMALPCHGPEWKLPPWPERTVKATRTWTRTSKRLITAFGKTQTLLEWANERQIAPETIRIRMDTYHWSAEDALSTKKQPRPGKAMRVK